MPKIVTTIPQYRRHSTRKIAFVQLGGRRIYLPGQHVSNPRPVCRMFAFHELCLVGSCFAN